MDRLTRGAVSALFAGDNTAKPTVQVIDCRQLASVEGTDRERFRLVISDGEHYQQAMLATQLNDMVKSGSIAKDCVVRLEKCITNDVSGRKVIIVLETTVVSPPLPSGRIGAPVNVEQRSAAAAPPAPPAAPTPAAPAYGGASYGAMARSPGMNSSVMPISALNPYANRWTIKVRVTSKSDVRTWSNSRGDGKLFSADLLDQHGDEIRATFFKEAVDKFYDVLQQDSVYLMSGGRLKLANKKFTSIKNDYEVTFDERSVIAPAEDTGGIKKIVYSFTPLSAIAGMSAEGPNTLDILGLVKDAGSTMRIQTRRGDEVSKRDVTLVDSSLNTIVMTFWGDRADEDPITMADKVIAVKGCKLSDFGGKSLSTFGSTAIEIEPDLPEAHALRSWWDGEGRAAGTTSLTEKGPAGKWGIDHRSMLNQIRDHPDLKSQWGGDATIKSTITFIAHDREPWYEACPSLPASGEKKCQKKVVNDTTAGRYYCEKCDKQFDHCDFRYVLSAVVADPSGTTRVTFFNDQAEALLGKTAKELHALKETDSVAYDAVFNQANFVEGVFRVKVKEEMVMDEPRLKCSVRMMRSVDFAAENHDMLAAIDKY